MRGAVVRCLSRDGSGSEREYGNRPFGGWGVQGPGALQAGRAVAHFASPPGVIGAPRVERLVARPGRFVPLAALPRQSRSCAVPTIGNDCSVASHTSTGSSALRGAHRAYNSHDSRRPKTVDDLYKCRLPFVAGPAESHALAPTANAATIAYPPIGWPSPWARGRRGCPPGTPPTDSARGDPVKKRHIPSRGLGPR